MLGIEKIKDVLAFPLSLHMAVDRARADGKIDAADLGFLVDPLMKAPAALSGAKEALKELRDLDDNERTAINQWAQSVYDIEDDGLEQTVESGLDLALSIAKFVGLLTSDEPETIE